MSEFDIRFSSSSSQEAGSFKILEIPPEICKFIEENDLSKLTVKGGPGDDAVLCTADKTYALRSVVLSNSILVIGAEGTEDDTVAIHDQLNEIAELIPTVPRLHKLDAILKGQEYDEGQEMSDPASDDEEKRTVQKLRRKRFTCENARDEIQASDAELLQALREKHILILDGALRPIAQSHLTSLLELLLNYLVSLSLPHTSASVEELVATLADEHEVPREVSTQVMEWFGTIEGGLWEMNITAVLKEVGLGILRYHKDEPISETDLFLKWKTAVGDTFESSVSLLILSGNYLSQTSALSPSSQLTYFPASALPVDPAARFGDLFLARARWRGDDIAPFLADIAVNSKERDKLLLKHARAVTDSEGVWYTARAKYNG